MTLGEKIQILRKQNGLSQEALAEKLAVTRQTVSKWELNRSMPDLDFIARLSELFHVSADYLIKDEMTAPDKPPVQKKAFRFTEKTKHTLLTAVSALELTAVLVCLVCDYFTAGSLSWSLIAIAAMAAGWFVLLPVLTAKEKVIFKTLLAASTVPLGSCISLVCIAAVWGIYNIFRKNRACLWRALGFALLVILPVPVIITYLAAHFLPQAQIDLTSALFNSGITVILLLACFGEDYLRRKKKEEP